MGAELTMREPDAPLPRYEHEARAVAEQLAAGHEIEVVARQLLADGYGPSMVARSLRVATAISLDAAFETVMGVLGSDASDRFRRVWERATVAAGATIRDVQEPEVLPGYVSLERMDFDDAFDTIVVERLVDEAGEADTIAWLQEQLSDLTTGPRALQALSLSAADRLGCPEQLVPVVLAAARAFDASFCRVPLAVLARNKGIAFVQEEYERMRRSPDAGDAAIARKWSYWLRADGWLSE